jgi:hypothetical protein
MICIYVSVVSMAFPLQSYHSVVFHFVWYNGHSWGLEAALPVQKYSQKTMKSGTQIGRSPSCRKRITIDDTYGSVAGPSRYLAGVPTGSLGSSPACWRLRVRDSLNLQGPWSQIDVLCDSGFETRGVTTNLASKCCDHAGFAYWNDGLK